MKRIVCLFVVIGICLGFCGCSGVFVKLNEEEQLAYNCAVKMKSMLKNPDSFKLYDTFYHLKKYDDDKNLLVTYTMFKYGGTNGYGAFVTGQAVFKDGEYLMDYGDEPDDEAENRYDQYFFKIDMSFFEAQKYLDPSERSYELVEIDVNRIEAKMGLE